MKTSKKNKQMYLSPFHPRGEKGKKGRGSRAKECQDDFPLTVGTEKKKKKGPVKNFPGGGGEKKGRKENSHLLRP